METFGEDFAGFQDEEPTANGDVKDAPVATNPASSADKGAATTSVTTSNVDKSKKSKVNAKSTGLSYQFQIASYIFFIRV